MFLLMPINFPGCFPELCILYEDFPTLLLPILL
jgi:hypothetical protein